MPKVGKMKFPYTEQGMKDAANYAKQTGKQLEIDEYRGGGQVRPLMPGIRPPMPGARPMPGMRTGIKKPTLKKGVMR
tara:strand:- start:643 stop:873 length:231 start_codon:yes stop_codon:yes gene_type:complete